MQINIKPTLIKRQNTGCKFVFRRYLNKYQAEQFGDHSLAATVQSIENKYQVNISRKLKNIPTRFGKSTYAAHYWLEEKEKDKLIEALINEFMQSGIATDENDAVRIIDKFGRH